MNYRTFLKVTIFTTLCIVFLNIIITEVFTRKVLVPNDIVVRKEKLLTEVQDKVKIISLGDSHIQNGIYIESKDFFNLAGSGEPIPIWYFKLKRFLNSSNNIQILLLQMDYHIFSHYRTVNIEAATTPYAAYIDEKIDRTLGAYPDPNTPQYFGLRSLQPNYAPIVHQALRNYLSDDFDIPSLASNGTEISTKEFIRLPEAERFRIAERRVQIHLQNGEIIDHNLLTYYERIILLAKQRGITVILVRSPLSKEYLSFVPISVQQEIDHVISQLRSTHQLPLLDYRYSFTEHQEYFLDEDHLNSNGAKKLGEFISADLEQISPRK